MTTQPQSPYNELPYTPARLRMPRPDYTARNGSRRLCGKNTTAGKRKIWEYRCWYVATYRYLQMGGILEPWCHPDAVLSFADNVGF